jgi:hypothetical protein
MPQSDRKREPDDVADLRRRRLMLFMAALLAVSVVGTVAVVTSREQDSLKSERSPRRAAATPVARITLEPTRRAPADARGLGEVVRREGRQELRVIAQNLRLTGDASTYRVYLARGEAQKTLGRVRTDRRGTLLGEARLAAGDLTRFTQLRISFETENSQRDVLRGDLPR